MNNREPLPNRREILAATVSAALLTAELQDSLARAKHDGSRPNATLVAGRALECKGQVGLALRAAECFQVAKWRWGPGYGRAAEVVSL